MQTITIRNLPYLTLVLMISFASVNAVFFTPALPDIARFFAINEDKAQLTIIWFLVGYAFGQLVYGPIANRYGRKPALYCGIVLQIMSSCVCVLSGIINEYSMLIIGRFFLALGSGVGLKMAFTLVNECYEPKIASQKIAYLMLAFAVTPGLAVALGGVLNTQYGWASCFYASIVYGIVLLLFVMKLPETLTKRDMNAFQLGHLIAGYSNQLTNKMLISGGLLMGCCSAFIYVFASVAPFIAINLLGMTSSQYGLANLLPPLGLIFGSLCSAKLANKYKLGSIVQAGIVISMIGVIIMIAAVYLKFAALFSLFLPSIVINFGLCFILANTSTVAMSQVTDKSHGSAVMNFINMGFATVVVVSLGLVNIKESLLPDIYFLLCLAMLILYRAVFNNQAMNNS